MTELCGKPISKAKNGADRGACTKVKGHVGTHGSETCSDCGQLLVLENARPSVVKKGCGDCRRCYKLRREKRRRAAGVPARTLRGTRDSIVGLNGKTRVEYATVYGHWTNIFHPNSETKQRCYADMPFHAAWNPDKGGSFKAGMLDLIADIGERAVWAKEHGVPERSVSLHIIDHAKGFVPGNLAWETKAVQSREQMCHLIAKLSHENIQLKKENRQLRAAKAA